MRSAAVQCRPGALRWALRFVFVALVLAAAGGSSSAARGTPTLTITPPSGPCDASVAIAGSGFTPGLRVGLVTRAIAPPSGQGVEFAALTVAADGTFRWAGTIVTLVPACRAATPPADGTVYTVYASTPPLADKTGGGPEVTLATATFTLGAALPGLPNTGGGAARLMGQVSDPGACAVGRPLATPIGGMSGVRRAAR